MESTADVDGLTDALDYDPFGEDAFEDELGAMHLLTEAQPSWTIAASFSYGTEARTKILDEAPPKYTCCINWV